MRTERILRANGQLARHPTPVLFRRDDLRLKLYSCRRITRPEPL